VVYEEHPRALLRVHWHSRAAQARVPYDRVLFLKNITLQADCRLMGCVQYLHDCRLELSPGCGNMMEELV